MKSKDEIEKRLQELRDGKSTRDGLGMEPDGEEMYGDRIRELEWVLGEDEQSPHLRWCGRDKCPHCQGHDEGPPKASKPCPWYDEPLPDNPMDEIATATDKEW